MSRLTKTFTVTDPTTIIDALSCYMANIEDSFIQSGFVCNKDYTRKTLIEAALPLLYESFKGGHMVVTCGWPK